MEPWEGPRAMRAASLVIVFLAAPLAGCFGGGEGPVEVAVSDGEVPDANISREERPDGRNGTFAGFQETNVTETGEGGRDHGHDMWQAAERITLLEADVRMTSRFAADGATAWAEASLPLADEKLVYEGTGQVEILLSNPQRRACEPVLYYDGDTVCTDFGTGTRVPDPDGGPAGLRIQLKHAASADWLDAGEATWAGPMVFPIADATWTDMPHSGRTLWSFRAISDDPALSTLTFDMKIEIVRAEGEIPLWPGHPEFYAASHERRVAEGSFKRSESLTDAYSGADPEVQKAVPGKLISAGTRTVHVWANITDLTTPPGIGPSGWAMEFHNATGGWRYTDASDPNHTGEVTEHYWVLEVTDDGMDSPYAEASRWGFRLRGDFEAQGPEFSLSCSGGLCANYEVTYDLVVVATDLVSEIYSPISVFSA